MVNEFSSLIYYDEEGKLKDYFFIGAYTNTSGVNDWSTYYYNDYLPDGRLDSFSLAADGDITAKTANATVNFTYDKYNRLTNKAYTYTASSSFTASASYTFTETTAATSSQIATHTSTVGTSSVTSTYTYDDNGYITKIVLSTGAEYRYVYDDLGQLKREDNTVTGKTYIYEYDDAGNITSKNTYSIAAAGVTPTLLLSSVTYGYNDGYEWGDLLTSYGNVTITYDEIGNPLSYYNGSSYTFTWKNGRQLATASVNGNTLSFNYNDEGIRTSKTVNGVVHTYHLSGSDIIAEEWGNNLIVYLYDADGSPMGMQYRTSSMAKGVFYTFWFEKNLQGDIVALYNSSGTKVISYTYDAWGNCTTTNHNISGTNSYATYNPFRYRGYYYDSELGFYYINSRYYDPAVSRFTNADVLVSTGQGLLGYNMFAYCNNNSVLYCDPLGNRCYIFNGINNNSEDGTPESMKQLRQALKEAGIDDDIRHENIYRGPSGIWGTLLGAGRVFLEMININVYSTQAANTIRKELEEDPLEEGEKLILIGYSGGGQIALNTMEKLGDVVDHVILIGAPVLETWDRSKYDVSLIYSSTDPLSWNIGWGFGSYNAGKIGHTSYFNSQNIRKTVSFIENIIK